MRSWHSRCHVAGSMELEQADEFIGEALKKAEECLRRNTSIDDPAENRPLVKAIHSAAYAVLGVVRVNAPLSASRCDGLEVFR